MGWHMKLVICVQLAYVSVCLTQLSVVHEWTSLDVQLISEDGLESRSSILPSRVYSWLLYKDRLFVSLLGQRPEYSLAYLDLTDNSTSALLRPYPRISIHDLDKVRVDRCGRLWVLLVMDDFRKHITAIDLQTDSVLAFRTFPHLAHSFDMVIDDFDCDNEYVYISNAKGVWTYSLVENDSWFHDTSIFDRIISMILAPNSIVYYNLAYESIVHYMSRTHLRDKSKYMTPDIRELRRIWKLNVDLASSALDAKSDVLYHFNDDNRTVIHAVPCWTSERCSTNCQDVSIDPTHKLNYITVDENGYLWAITSRSSFEDGEINFRLLSVPVKSICVESNARGTTNTTNINEITTAASSTTEQTSTLGSVPKHTTVNIAHTTAGTPNSNITQAIGGTNMPYLLFSFTNTTLNLSNFSINNFTYYYNNFH